MPTGTRRWPFFMNLKITMSVRVSRNSFVIPRTENINAPAHLLSILLMEKSWNILQAEAAKVESLQTALRINEILCRILVQRGITTYDAAKTFFRPDLSDLHDP